MRTESGSVVDSCEVRRLEQGVAWVGQAEPERELHERHRNSGLNRRGAAEISGHLATRRDSTTGYV